MKGIIFIVGAICLTLVSCKKDIEPTTSGAAIKNSATITLTVSKASSREPINLTGLQVFSFCTNSTWKTTSGAVVLDMAVEQNSKPLGFYNFAFTDANGNLHSNVCDAYLEKTSSDHNYKLTCKSRGEDFTFYASINVQPFSTDMNQIEIGNASIDCR